MSERDYAKSIIDIIPEERLGDVIEYMMSLPDNNFDEEKFKLESKKFLLSDEEMAKLQSKVYNITYEGRAKDFSDRLDRLKADNSESESYTDELLNIIKGAEEEYRKICRL